jgi:zinc transporter ZupT
MLGVLVKNWPQAMQLFIVGFYVAFSLLIPIGIGFWFDKKVSHEFPSFTLIGLGVGTVIMVYGVYRMIKPFWAEARKEQLRGPARMISKLVSPRQKKDEEQNNG